MKKVYLLSCLLWIVLFSDAMTLADFEKKSVIPTLSADGGIFYVVANPDKSGINNSDTVAYYHKLDTNWQYFTMTFDSAVPIGNNNTLTFHVRASKAGRIFAKFWNGNSVLIENWAPEWEFMPTANKWVECVMDLTPAMGKKFTALQIAACVDNLQEAEVFLDNFTLSNPDAGDGRPFALFTVSQSMVETGDSIVFDASASYDYDGNIEKYHWDFGDGKTDSSMVVSHPFTSEGVYAVQLSLTDNDDKISIASTYVFVVDSGEKLSALKFISSTPQTHEKIEAIFQVNRSYSNFYNPDEIKVDAEVSFPDSSKLIIPCFYFEKSRYAKSEWVIDSSLSCWMLRFSTGQTGIHKVVLTLKDGEGEEKSPAFTIIVMQGNKKGIIRNDDNNRQYYRHSGGEPFYPMGINEGWDNIKDYTSIINNLGQNKANIIRYWHAGFAKQALEWTGSYYKKLGYYSQQSSAMTDSVIELCRSNDVYMQLVIYQHGMFSENVDANWSDNPYNSANGGLIDRAEKFFYTESCKASVRKVLRYMVARWGYSANLFAWEFFNEVQFTGVFNSQTPQWYPGVLQWHSEMGNYMQNIDPYNHILTTSAAIDQLKDFDTIQVLDVVQYHLYSPDLTSNLKTYDDRFRQQLEYSAVINGEYGSANGADVEFNDQRNLIWSSVMTQVPRFMWIWDHYLDVNWAGLFEMPVKFLENTDLAKETNLDYANLTLKSNIPGIQAIGLKSDSNCYGYVYDPSYSDNINGIVARITGIPYANYKVSYYLPVENQVITIDTLPLIANQVKLNLPQFSKSIAFKAEYLSEYTLPIAIAGIDTIVSPGVSILLSGLKSFNPSGKPLTYQWRIVSKPTGSQTTISDPALSSIEIVTDIIGEYNIGLTVKDDTYTSLENIVTISVTGLPVAMAGKDTTVSKSIGIFVNLDGSASYDPEGAELTYLWTMVSKPEGSNGMMFSYDSPKSIARFDSVGIYIITLVVSDGITFSLPDSIILTVTPVTGIKIYELTQQIEIFPNPFNNYLILTNHQPEMEILQINLYNMSGKKIWESMAENYTIPYVIDLTKNRLRSGMYIVMINTSLGLVEKLIIKD